MEVAFSVVKMETKELEKEHEGEDVQKITEGKEGDKEHKKNE